MTRRVYWDEWRLAGEGLPGYVLLWAVLVFIALFYWIFLLSMLFFAKLESTWLVSNESINENSRHK